MIKAMPDQALSRPISLALITLAYLPQAQGDLCNGAAKRGIRVAFC